ncbi:MAG: hypothetical protein SFU25_09195 [Candidatus Caenarcaniphilales bacterium]|nr:hypothetical protein [Candidatus Caenarcaniphilales bacterium]
MSLVSSSLRTWTRDNPPSWANDPNFGFKPRSYNSGSQTWMVGANNRYNRHNDSYGAYPSYGNDCNWYLIDDSYYTPNPRPDRPNPRPPRPNPRPNPDPNPRPDPNPPAPGPDPVDPDPTPNPDPNTINISGARQANLQPNFFDLRDQPGTRRNLQIAPNSAAVFNNLNNGVDANVGANFGGYIGGFSTDDNTPGATIRGQGGGVNAIVHSFNTFQGAIDNTDGRAPIEVDLQGGGAPDRMIVIGGEGRINGVENLTLFPTRTGQNGHRGFDISGAQNIRIVAVSIQEVGRQGGTRTFRDERGAEFRIQDPNNSVSVTATGSRDRSVADNTFTDIPGQAPRQGVRQNGALPHDTVATAANGEVVLVDGISPSNDPTVAATPQNDQPTPNAGRGTATGGNPLNSLFFA